MGCNCKTREEIDRLYEAFGEKKKLPKKPKFKDYIRYYVGNSFLFVLFLCMFPIMFVYILLIYFGGRVIGYMLKILILQE